jgi:murein DD-endopeptidase MepM/ murein hydrolase activator NlpD
MRAVGAKGRSRWRIRTRTLVGALGIGGASLCLIGVSAGPLPAMDRAGGRLSGTQGQILVVRVVEADRAAKVSGTFLGRAIPFFPDPSHEEPVGYVGLLGLDLQQRPGIHTLSVEVTSQGHRRRVLFRVQVGKGTFPIQHLTLPREKVDLDEASLARWKAEQQQVREALATDSLERHWESRFLEPVQGVQTGVFGSVRVLNGQPRNPHNGIDIAAPLGTEVRASSEAVVRLTVDHLLSGKGVYLDHGLGLYTMYFHLSEVLVEEGEVVRVGQAVGRIGASGRASGPHLHWGAKLNGARINPEALLALFIPNRSRAEPDERSPVP